MVNTYNKDEAREKAALEYPKLVDSSALMAGQFSNKEKAKLMSIRIRAERDKIANLILESRKIQKEIKLHQHTSRNDNMLDLYNKGHTLQAVGNMYGLTRERVRQLLNETGKYHKHVAAIYKFTSTCKTCRESFTVETRSSKSIRRIFCSRDCQNNYERTPEEVANSKAKRAERNRKNAYRIYHEVIKKRPDFKEITSERNRKYRLKKKAEAFAKRK